MNQIGRNLIDQIFHRNCMEGMKMIPDACIPMTLTSPPYEALRGFGGHDFGPEVFEAIARELWRVTMPGGVVCWVVADQIEGTYSGTSLRQALFFQEIGFRIHDILIMSRRGGGFAGGNRYGKVEFAFVLSKGRPRSVHLIRDRENSHAGQLRRFRTRRPDGSIRCSAVAKPIAAMGLRGPVWEYHSGNGCTTRDRYAHGHSALMHEDMARDLILSWSRPGDLIVDPMCGAATTCKMALLNDRDYLGFEVHEPYHRIAVRRMEDAHVEYRRRLDDWLVAGPSPDLRSRRPGGGYEVIYADPPWGFKPWGRSRRGRNVQDHYRTMTPEEIMSLPVGELAARDAVLLLWATGPFLAEAVRTVEAWGFDYKTEGFTWVKTRGGKLFTGLGYHTRANAEFCLLATKGKGLRRGRKDVHQVVISEVMRYSEKPEEVRRRIEALYGPRRRVELFARREAPGWDALGDAIDGRDIRDAIGARLPEARMRALQLVC